jgi:hemolysin D
MNRPTSHSTESAENGPGMRAPRKRIDVAAPIHRKLHRPLPEFTGLSIPRDERDASHNDFLPDAMRIVLTPPSRLRRTIAYTLCGIISTAILWSIFGYLRLFAIASGEFQARGGNQVVEPLEAGEVSSILVKNGTHVEKDRIVVQLDPTSAQAAKAIVESKLATSRAQAIRYRAAAVAAQTPIIDKNPPVAWPDTVPADVRAREETVLYADLAGLAASIAEFRAKLSAEQAGRDKDRANINAQTTLIDSRTKTTAMHETLAQKGWDSRAVVLQSLEPLRQAQVTVANYQGLLDEADAAIAVIDNQIAQARQTFVAENVDSAAKANRETASLVEQLKKADLALANLSLRAPVSGVVQSLALANIGQEVKVGDKLLQIVPDNAPLEIRAYVLNDDIGFVKVGQPVKIKIDTFPYTRYGTISGHVSRVGADAVTGKYALAQQKDDAATPSKGSLSATNPGQQFNDLIFPVTVIADKVTINVEGRDVPLTAGMSVVVEIETERQRVISYIVYPLTRSFYRGKPQG